MELFFVYNNFMVLDKKKFCIIFLVIMFFAFLILNFLFNNQDESYVKEVLSPTEFVLKNGEKYVLTDISVFDADYTDKNKEQAKVMNITEDEAFILGNLGRYWAKNFIEGRKIKISDNDLIYYKFGYLTRLKNSSFSFVDGKPVNQQAFNRQLASIRRGKFVILDLDTDVSYPVSKESRAKVKNFVVVRKSHVKNILSKHEKEVAVADILYNPVFDSGNIKIIVSDLTTKVKPDRNCSSEICKEILSSINSAKNSIDIAIYGYSSTPEIEKAINRAKSRGVKIRLVYDIDSKGENIYPDTFKFVKIVPDNMSDKNSAEVRNTMHNKFYIFDNQKVITGSANLSHTDMSGYNSNSIIVINMPEVAKIYTNEFNRMYGGNFHNDKNPDNNKVTGNIQVYFSPQDKGIKNGILPLIKNAKKYIYVPTFVITEKGLTAELIKARQRGVDVRVIADALNASTKHSKHKELRNSGIQVKAENYAGKMHSKTMIIDDEYLVIGSMNFSNSGENRNDENMIILQDKEAVKFYKTFFIYQWNRIPDKWLKYTPRAEGIDSVGSCSDGIDNNYDGKTDLEDEGCKK